MTIKPWWQPNQIKKHKPGWYPLQTNALWICIWRLLAIKVASSKELMILPNSKRWMQSQAKYGNLQKFGKTKTKLWIYLPYLLLSTHHSSPARKISPQRCIPIPSLRRCQDTGTFLLPLLLTTHALAMVAMYVHNLAVLTCFNNGGNVCVFYTIGNVGNIGMV